MGWHVEDSGVVGLGFMLLGARVLAELPLHEQHD